MAWRRTKVCLSKRGLHAEAEKYHRRAAETYTLWYSACDPCTLGTLSNLACCLDAQGRTQEADPLHRRVVAGLRAALGATHPQTLRAEELASTAASTASATAPAAVVAGGQVEGTWASKIRPGPILKACTTNAAKTPVRCSICPRVGSPSYKSCSPLRLRPTWRPAQVLITRAQLPARARV